MKGSIFFLSVLLCISICVSKLEAAEAAPIICEEYQVRSLIETKYPVTALSVNRHTNQVAACCRRSASILEPAQEKSPDECVFIWDPDKSKPRHSLHNNSGPVTTLHWHPRQQQYPYLATGSEDKTITILNPTRSFGKKRQKFSDDAMGEIRAVAWHPTQDILVSVSDDAQASDDQRNALRIWQFFNWFKQPPSKFRCEHRRPIDAVGWNPSGDTIVSGGDQEMRIWDPYQGHAKRKIDGEGAGAITALDWQDDHYFVTGAGGGGFSSMAFALILWDRRNLSATGLLTGHQDKINSVKFDPSFSYELVSASDDGTIRTWDLRTLGGAGRYIKTSNVNVRVESEVACLQVLKEHTDAATSIDFYSSQDKHKFASGSSDSTIRIMTKPVGSVPDRQAVREQASKEEADKAEEERDKAREKKEAEKADAETKRELKIAAAKTAISKCDIL